MKAQRGPSQLKPRFVSQTMTTQTGSFLPALMPAFARELEMLMLGLDRSDLAAQVPSLRLVARCKCGDRDCAHLYTELPPEGAYGTGHSNLVLPATSGMIVLDLIDSRIVAVEVLDRPDVKSSLDQYLPLARSH